MNRLITTHAILCILVIIGTPHARTLSVGPTREISDIVEASNVVQDGDTVEIDTGLYINQACTWNARNTFIRGVDRYAHFKAPDVIPNRKAILVITGDNTILENIAFSDASVPDKNGAGIRLEGRNVIIKNCRFHHCEDGILGGKEGYVIIEHSEFGYCGYGDGYSHNMYISSCDSFVLQFCYTHNTSEGHPIKSRAVKNYILYNRIESANSTASYEINLPNGGTSIILGNQIQQGKNSHNGTIIDYGSEGISGHDSTLYVVNNTIVNERGSGTFINIRNTRNTPTVVNNIFTGGGAICSVPMDSGGNYIGNDPCFVDSVHYNYHITSSSPARARGVDPGAYGSFTLTPLYEYVHRTSGNLRDTTGNRLDAGAYAFSDLGVSLPYFFHPSFNSIAEDSNNNLNPCDLLGRRIDIKGQDVHRRTALTFKKQFVNFRLLVSP